MKPSFLKGSITHLILILVCFLSLLPLMWLTSTAFKGAGENIFAYPPILFPENPTFKNFSEVLKYVPIVGYIVNSFIVAGVTVVLNVILSALAAYPLARMEFRGKKISFFLILSTIMVPFQAIMLPVYIITLKLGLSDTNGYVAGYLGMILPFAVNAFGIFLLRQAFISIPRELEESAFIDGCNVLQIWFKVLLPLILPQITVLAIFTFIGSWGEFLWPSIVLTKEALFTLPVGINNMSGVFASNYRLVAAGSIISIIPIIVFFISLQKYFIKGSSEGAVKG